MASAELRVYLDNEPASEEQLELFREVRVEQAMGLAAEAQLQIDLQVDDDGRWQVVEDDFTQVAARVRVEIKVDEGDFIPLIEGPIVGQRFELSATPGTSRLLLVVQDDSVLLNQDEDVELYENSSPDEIAANLFQQYGLRADTDTVSPPAGTLSRYLVRRGTPMQFLRELARRHGMLVYVEPDQEPGRSRGVFKRPQAPAGEYPDLLLLGAQRNINRFAAQFDGLRPLAARAASLDAASLDAVNGAAEQSSLNSQGEDPVHTLLTPARVLLARTREEQADLDAASAAAVDHSSWAYTAQAEVSMDNYLGVLAPYRTVNVTGAGGHLSGAWLISEVRHTITDGGYTQALGLRRDARSAAAGGSLPGGIF